MKEGNSLLKQVLCNGSVHSTEWVIQNQDVSIMVDCPG